MREQRRAQGLFECGEAEDREVEGAPVCMQQSRRQPCPIVCLSAQLQVPGSDLVEWALVEVKGPNLPMWLWQAQTESVAGVES